MLLAFLAESYYHRNDSQELLMKDLFLVFEKIKMTAKDGYSDSGFKSIMADMAQFFQDNFALEKDEIAILLADKDKNVLSFAFPNYLINAGIIPISSPDAIAAQIFKLNRGLIENTFNQLKHLHLFEYIRNDEQKIRPIWKMMGTVLHDNDGAFGVIELSRKAISQREAGEDFTRQDLEFLEKAVARLAPVLRQTMPPEFKVKLT
jgi:hypothetical protein